MSRYGWKIIPAHSSFVKEYSVGFPTGRCYYLPAGGTDEWRKLCGKYSASWSRPYWDIVENVKKRKNFFVRDSSASIVAERLFKIDRRRKSEKHSGNWFTKMQVEKRDGTYFFGQQFLAAGAEISSEMFLGMSFLISVWWYRPVAALNSRVFFAILRAR